MRVVARNDGKEKPPVSFFIGGSAYALARKILDNWEEHLRHFIKVTPIEYKKVLQEEKMEAIKKKIQAVESDY